MPEQPLSDKDFWRQKLLQILHDPPAKPYESMPGLPGKGRGGHEAVAKKIAARFAEISINFFRKKADYTMTGADRPVFPYNKTEGGQIQVNWPGHPLITHPLSPDCRLYISPGPIGEEAAGVKEKKEEISGLEDQAVAELASGRSKDGDKVWDDPEKLKDTFLKVWRSLRPQLIYPHDKAGDDDLFRLLWQVMPADSRCPDHSIWDHCRMVSALAFLPEAKTEDPPRGPWLFRFEIGPVGRFINEARTSRDLWMGSYLLSDLIWHAMVPVIEQYGPDCIVFPDLRENPLADIWLQKNYPDALPPFYKRYPGRTTSGADPDSNSDGKREIFTYAAVLPNTFTAVLPLGTDKPQSHLIPLQDLAREAQNKVQDRWMSLSGTVKDWLTRIQADNSGRRPSSETEEWHRIWDRQQKGVIHCTWSAVRWSKSKALENPESMNYKDPLVCQKPRDIPAPSDHDKAVLEQRENDLHPFVEDPVWAHYNRARLVFARTSPQLFNLERGFDYALVHHQLRARHALRKLQNPEAGIFDQQGEKCTVCGKRQAVYALGNQKDRLNTHRKRSREFWAGLTAEASRRLNPDPDHQDRLCGVCAIKRFLVEAGIDDKKYLTGINESWAGVNTPVKALGFRDDIPRVPFPSTCTLAVQDYLSSICEDSRMTPYLEKVSNAWNDSGIPNTGFACSLKKIARIQASGGNVARSFLEMDTQQSLFPETLDISIRKADLRKEDDPEKTSSLKRLKKEVEELRKTADQLFIKAPNTQIAVVRMDGDDMGRLLLGDPEIIRTRWKDIIHPDAIDPRAGSKQKTLRTHPVTVGAGWPDLLDAKRLMGPSLHAFISRALAVFSHRIAPWVVEMEFDGRMIYSGGDDILAMVPAGQALAMAARLQQLFSAPFVLDTQPDAQPWAWRKPGGAAEPVHNPKDRFLIPKMMPVNNENRSEGIEKAVQLPVRDVNAIEPYIYEGYGFFAYEIQQDQTGEILPLLGKGHSLSAGIAYGHFKHPLSNLLVQSKIMLETWAKNIAGKSAVGMSRCSRNGTKTRFAMPWSQDDGLSNVKIFDRVIHGFKGLLPKRLPYKLAEYQEMMDALFRTEKDPENMKEVTDNLKQDLEKKSKPDPENTNFIKGLFRTALEEGAADNNTTEAALAVWKLGISLSRRAGQFKDLSGQADGLILARYLSSLGDRS